jgi:uncharacterized protein (DUF486 family)
MLRAMRQIWMTIGLLEPLKLDFLWAGLCILGAVYFMFRSRWGG